MQLNDIALLQRIFMKNFKEIISILSHLSRGLLPSDNTGYQILTEKNYSGRMITNDAKQYTKTARSPSSSILIIFREAQKMFIHRFVIGIFT
jgi:hypothetical protein